MCTRPVPGLLDWVERSSVSVAHCHHITDCDKGGEYPHPLTLSKYSSSPPLWSIRLEGGKRLADLVDQLILECCHSFLFYGSCRKRIPIRDSSMPKRILSQCGVSSDVFIGLIVPTTCSSICWD